MKKKIAKIFEGIHRAPKAHLELQDGYEVPDPQPAALPVGFKRPVSIQEQIRRSIRTEMSMAAMANGQESWEESNDFTVDDDVEIRSEYELNDEMMQDGNPFVEEVPKENPPAADEPKDETPPPEAAA